MNVETKHETTYVIRLNNYEATTLVEILDLQLEEGSEHRDAFASDLKALLGTNLRIVG